jgi:hypothetical protein
MSAAFPSPRRESEGRHSMTPRTSPRRILVSPQRLQRKSSHFPGSITFVIPRHPARSSPVLLVFGSLIPFLVKVW